MNADEATLSLSLSPSLSAYRDEAETALMHFV